MTVDNLKHTIMRTNSHIDWLAVTMKTGKEALPLWLENVAYEEIKPRLGYSAGRKFVNGVIEYTNGHNERMGTHVIYSGGALRDIRQIFNEKSDKKYHPLNWHVAHNHNIARVDYALDMLGLIPDIKSLLKQHEMGQVETKVRLAPKTIISGTDQYETMYIGSQKKRKKLLRVYRKDIQLGGGYAEKWLRAELEVRGKSATASAYEHASKDDEHASVVGMIKGFCNYPYDHAWQLAMQSEPVNIAVETHLQGNTEKWLLDQVAPAFAREYMKSDTIMDKFIEKVKYHMREIEAQSSKT